MLNKQGKYAEAEEMLRKVLPRLNIATGKYSQQAIGTTRELCRAVGGQGKWEEAEQMYVDGLELIGGSGMVGDDKETHLKWMKEVGYEIEGSKVIQEVGVA